MGGVFALTAAAAVMSPGGASAQEVDHCTLSPEGVGPADFAPACAAHDECYSATSSTDRMACDVQFEADLRAACEEAHDGGMGLTGCYGAASTYFAFVRAAGMAFYDGTGSPW